MFARFHRFLGFHRLPLFSHAHVRSQRVHRFADAAFLRQCRLAVLNGAPRRPQFPTHRRRLAEHFIALVDFRFLQGCSELKGRPVHYPDRGIINYRARRLRTLPGTQRFYFALRGVLRRSTSLPDARSPVCLMSIDLFRGPRLNRWPSPVRFNFQRSKI